MKVIVYTRQGCPLCDKGIAIARDVFGYGMVKLVDVDLDLALLEEYTDRVPVIVTHDGVVIEEGIIDGSVLQACLDSNT